MDIMIIKYNDDFINTLFGEEKGPWGPIFVLLANKILLWTVKKLNHGSEGVTDVI